MSSYPQKIVNWFLDTVFPKKCLGCSKFTQKGDFDYVCGKCFLETGLKNNLECIGCKRQARIGLTCKFCREDNPIDPVGNFSKFSGQSYRNRKIYYGVDQLIIAAELSDKLIDKMLKAYKYKFIADMYLPLAVIAKKRIKKLLKRGFNLFEDVPLFVPVPLHKTRLNERGFNQSWLITKILADAFHISSEENILSKKHNFKHQVNTKSREERLNNIKGNFIVKNPEIAKNKTIILVDDICTTGATLNECARVLKAAGAKRVIGFVIARGQFKKISNY